MQWHSNRSNTGLGSGSNDIWSYKMKYKQERNGKSSQLTGHSGCELSAPNFSGLGDLGDCDGIGDSEDSDGCDCSDGWAGWSDSCVVTSKVEGG